MAENEKCTPTHCDLEIERTMMPSTTESQSAAPRAGGGISCIRYRFSATLALLVLAGLIATVAGEDRVGQGSGSRLRTASDSQRNGSRISNLQEGPLVREGEVWENELGHILVAGQRYAFRPIQGGRSVIVLENLNLQRIVQRLEESSQPTIWSISGRVTEFQGGNYLLIERATRKGQASLQAAGQR